MKDKLKKVLLLGILVIICLLILVQETSFFKPLVTEDAQKVTLVEPEESSQDKLTIESKDNTASHSNEVGNGPQSQVIDLHEMTEKEIFFKGMRLTVDDLLISEGDAVTKPQTGNVFAVIEISLSNASQENLNVDPLYFTLANELGQIVDVSMAPLFTSLKLERLILEPGASIQGVIIFEVPQGDQKGVLRYAPSILEREELLKIQLKYPVDEAAKS